MNELLTIESLFGRQFSKPESCLEKAPELAGRRLGPMELVFVRVESRSILEQYLLRLEEPSLAFPLVPRPQEAFPGPCLAAQALQDSAAALAAWCGATSDS